MGLGADVPASEAPSSGPGYAVGMRPVRQAPIALLGVLVTLSVALAACGPNPSPGTPKPSGATSQPPTTGLSSPSGSGTASGPTRIPLLLDLQDPVGTTRLLFGMLDAKNNPIGGPDMTINVAFYEVAKSTDSPVATVPAKFIWTIPPKTGIYELTTTFADAGDWIAEFTSTAAGLTERTRVQFQVSPTSPTPVVGTKAPDTRTPTLADVGGDVKQVSTDTSPDLDFYKVSVHDALAQHKPFVLVFATPAFCTSKVCGPTLDSIKAIAKTEPGMIFINVEPYKMSFANGHLQPVLDAQNYLQATDVTNAWGLPTEPWIFVVDKDGIVRGSWSTVVDPGDLTAAIDAVK